MNAFADNLGTITAGKNAADTQNIQAGWILSFYTFTGLVMNPAKNKPTNIGPLLPYPAYLIEYSSMMGSGWTLPHLNTSECTWISETIPMHSWAKSSKM
jgi:hypothetical protein